MFEIPKKFFCYYFSVALFFVDFFQGVSMGHYIFSVMNTLLLKEM